MAVITKGEEYIQTMIDILEKMLQHRRTNPTVKSDELYYKYISNLL